MSSQDKHILLVDDDRDMHEAIRLILEPLGYRLTCCTTAPEARAALRRELPDLLLLDIMLATPHEGLVLAKEIKNDHRLGQIPMLMISSIGESLGMDYANELDGSGMPGEGFLEKPLDPQRLRDNVCRLLNPNR